MGLQNDYLPSFFSGTPSNNKAGGVAGICAKSVIAPIERIKILFTVTQYHNVD
jgi:hypothetical protein